jgi:hypothetical protein
MSKYHSAEIWENKAEIWEKFIFCRIDMGKYVKIHKSGDMGKYRGDMKFPLLRGNFISPRSYIKIYRMR